MEVLSKRWAAMAAVGAVMLAGCGADKGPDEQTRRVIFKQLQEAEKHAEVLAFQFIQNAENPREIENVEKYRAIRRDSSVAAWDKIMEASGWDREWADSIWTQGLKSGWSDFKPVQP